MPSLSLLLGVGAATLSSTVLATKYTAQDTYAGNSFFDGFNFVTEEKTNGFVKYVDRSRAESKGYISFKDGDAVFGVDHLSKLSSTKDTGRESVRLEGKTEYNKGLFVLDVKHMPGGICGTWPAFWSLGREPWPVKGEIDIIEGVNKNSVNKFVLHTDTKCKTDGKGQTGVQSLYDCALDSSSGASGCDVNDVNTNSYGAGFNANQGGHYVTEWQADGIKMWFFPRGKAPASLTTSEPDTSEFGTPNANFKGDCDVEKRFLDQRFIFTNTFCGDWAGNVYAQSGCPMYSGLSGMESCKKYVAEHPEVFEDAYWRVGSFKTYNKRSISSSSSVAPSSTPHASSSSSVSVSSSSAHVSSSSVHISSSSAHVSSSSSVAPSSTPHATSSSSVHLSSSSTQSSSSSLIVSSPSVGVSSSASSSAAASSSASSSASASASSSSVDHQSASSTPVSSSSYEPSSSIAASSSYSQDVSSSSVHDSSSTYSPSASETPYPTDSSSSIASSVYSPSASETPYPSDSSSSSSVALSSAYGSSASETPYPTDSSSSIASSSVYSPSASETPYDTTAVYPSGTSSSVIYPDVTSYPVDQSSSNPAYPDSTSAPVYSVYPEGDGYGHGTVSSKTPDASSKPSDYPTASSKYPDASSKVPDYEGEYPTASSKVPEYDSYPTASTKTPEYNDYATTSASAPVYGDEYPTHSVPTPSAKSTPVYNDYPELPSFVPLYPTYADVSSKPSYGNDNAQSSGSSPTTTAYETTYVDVCPTGYTTITTKVTAIQTATPYPTTDAYYAPPGFEVTTKYCAQGCGSSPTTVTVTVPHSKYEAATSVPNKPTKPSTPDNDLKSTVPGTKVPVPETQYPETHPTSKPSKPVSPTPLASQPLYPTGSAPASKPVQPTANYPIYPTGSASPSKPVQPTHGQPTYPSIVVIGHNTTLLHETATSAYTKPTQTGYKTPEFTGAASHLRVGSVVAGAVALFAAMMV